MITTIFALFFSFNSLKIAIAVFLLGDNSLRKKKKKQNRATFLAKIILVLSIFIAYSKMWKTQACGSLLEYEPKKNAREMA